MKESRQSPIVAKLLTAAELAPALGISEYTVLALARDGRLPCVRIGHRVRFAPDIVTRLTEQAYSQYQKQVEKSAEDQAPEDLDSRRYGVSGIIQDYPRPTRRRRMPSAQVGEPRTMREAVKCYEADLERQKAG